MAYLLFLGSLALEDHTSFPFFDCLSALVLSFIVQPVKKFNLVIATLGIPICIANFYLRVRILTFPSLFILYLPVYLQNEYYKMTIFWLLSIITLICFAILIVPSLKNRFSGDSSYIFYYIFPFLLYAEKIIMSISHHLIKHFTIPVIQFSLLLLGL